MKRLSAVLAILFLPKIASAHAFGQLYNLPVPFWLYLYGGAGAIILSFLIVGYFLNKTDQEFSYTQKDLFRIRPMFSSAIKILSVFLLILTIATGLFGENSSFSNFNMTFFWIIFALGLTYATALIGNVYEFINPWKVMTEWMGKTFEKGLVRYPLALGYYPALLFYFIFIWFELVGETAPFKLSVVLILYTAINILGAVTFGRAIWFHYCEFFSVFFRLIGKVSPVEYKAGRLLLRPPFVGLVKESADHFSLLIFTLFMLSSTAYDGFSETLPWVRFYWFNLDSIVRPIIGGSAYAIFDTLGLLLSPVIFLVIYLILIASAKAITKSSLSLKELTLQFTFSLIPIALVYNIAHYFSLLFTEGPSIIRLISDPFGFGWNLFSTGNFFGRLILDTSWIWHLQVAFILFGHIVSVYLAHVAALKIFRNHRQALMSQVPMLILMVAYTMIGLWILSQPITGGTL